MRTVITVYWKFPLTLGYFGPYSSYASMPHNKGIDQDLHAMTRSTPRHKPLTVISKDCQLQPIFVRQGIKFSNYQKMDPSLTTP